MPIDVIVTPTPVYVDLVPAQQVFVEVPAPGGYFNSVVGTDDRISIDITDPRNPIFDIDEAYDAAVQAMIDASIQAGVIGLWDDRGNYDASVNLFPSTGGSGTAGAVKKGDIWTVSVAGTPGGTSVDPPDTIRSLSDNPGQTASNWAISEGNLGYTPESASNKDTDSTFAANSDVKYPSQKAVKTVTDKKVSAIYFNSLIPINPADGTPYYFGVTIDTFGWTTSAGFRTFYPGVTGTVIAASITYFATVTPTASTELSTLSLRVNDTTDYQLSNAINVGAAVFSTRLQTLVTGLNIAIVNTDFMEIKWVTPTWATNPNNIYMSVILYVRA